MAVSNVPSQSGRSTRQRQTATPARNESPNARGTRSGSAAPRATPATRRSARTTSRITDQPKDIINNPALPEIQTRQSYAYGSTKAPQLPEQLYARGTMSMQQVADQMNTDIHRAQLNLAEDNTDEIEPTNHVPTRSQKQPVPNLENEAAQARRRQTTPGSQTTEFQKQRRTAAWASSLDESQLDDIAEESTHPDSPETRRTDPSSFPSGIFDHSYAYERGIRAPRREHLPSRTSVILGAIRDHLTRSLSATTNAISQFEQSVRTSLTATGRWLSKIEIGFPPPGLTAMFWRAAVALCVAAFISTTFCYFYRNVFCDMSSNSQLTQLLQRYCGACQTAYTGSFNLTGSDHNGIHKLTATLNSINSRINSLESKLANRIDSKYASVQTEMDALRRQQSDLTGLLQNLGKGSDGDIASPLMPSINFFAPANGAVINPFHTSPTRSRAQFLPVRVVLNIMRLNKYEVNGPVTALLPWQDVGDCWCASSSLPGQDSVRLGVEVKEMIYPTELVIEHPPVGTTLYPDTAPRELELWADVTHLTPDQRTALRIHEMVTDGAGVRNPLSNKNDRLFAKLAAVEYDASSNSNHVQRFKLDVNHFRDLKYSAQLFVLRARTNHGADYSCLYRVRLHGVPVRQDSRQSKFTKDWLADSSANADE